MTTNYCIGCIHYNDGKHEIDCEFCDPPFEDRKVIKHDDLYESECEDNDRDETYNC